VNVREPRNDRCTEAFGPLSVGQSIAGTTTNANLDFGDGSSGLSCNGAYNQAPDIWYWTMGTGHVMVADTCSDFSYFDIRIQVFLGDCDKGESGLWCVDGNDNGIECGTLTDRRSRVSW
jgi:hypothetical protein